MAQILGQGEHGREEGSGQGHLGKNSVCHMLEAYEEQVIILPPLWVLLSGDTDMNSQMGITGSTLLKKVVTPGHVAKPGCERSWFQSLCC